MNVIQQLQPAAWIRFLHGPLSGRTIDIVHPITTVGRLQDNNVVQCPATEAISNLCRSSISSHKLVLTIDGRIYSSTLVNGCTAFIGWTP